jgi:CheY-like chemotaxis protein
MLPECNISFVANGPKRSPRLGGLQRACAGNLIAARGVNITAVRTGKEAFQRISAQQFGCVILDLGLPDMTGLELLRDLSNLEGIELPPVVVYTAREVTHEEHQELSRYAKLIVIKGANSLERVLDETALFLHSVTSNLSTEQASTIRMLHDPDQVLQGRKILLVDDDTRNTFALSSVLEKAGMEVVMADNGQLAIEKLEAETDIDLVLMDIMMPVMDGHAAIQAIRDQPRFKELPIIALTAKAMPEDRSKCLESGANDYMTKPVDVEKLLSLMRVWLFKRETATV